MAGDRVPSLEEIYDDEVLALIEQYTRRPGAARQVSVMQVVDPATASIAPVPWIDDDELPADDVFARDDLSAAATDRGDGGDPDEDAVAAEAGRVSRWGVGGAMMVGAMMGIAEVLEPERAKQHIIEFAPDEVDQDQQLVTFVHVPGDPRASRLIIRPWLLAAHRERLGEH